MEEEIKVGDLVDYKQASRNSRKGLKTVGYFQPNEWFLIKVPRLIDGESFRIEIGLEGFKSQEMIDEWIRYAGVDKSLLEEGGVYRWVHRNKLVKSKPITPIEIEIEKIKTEIGL